MVSKNKLKVIAWNLRSYDTRVKDANKMLSKLLRQVKSGSSVLFHDRVDATSEILPQLLEDLKSKKLIVYPEFKA